MIKLLLSGFLLIISCISNAATIQPTDQTDRPIQFIDKKNTTSSEQVQTKNELAIDSSLPELHTHQLNPTKNTQKSFFISTATRSPQFSDKKQHSSPKLAEFAEKLKSEYEDNELVQQSLSTFYEAKQFWSIADSQANTFATDIVHSFNLNKLIEDDLSNTLHSTQNPSVSFFLKKQVNFSRQSTREKNITFNQVRQTLANTPSQNISTLNSHFVAQLFRMKTVYYLLAFFILFSILQWAIKFTLRFFP